MPVRFDAAGGPPCSRGCRSTSTRTRVGHEESGAFVKYSKAPHEAGPGTARAILRRGKAVDVIPEDDLMRKLERAVQSGKPLRVKLGGGALRRRIFILAIRWVLQEAP